MLVPHLGKHCLKTGAYAGIDRWGCFLYFPPSSLLPLRSRPLKPSRGSGGAM